MSFFTAAELVSQLEKAQKQYTLDKFLGQLERAQLLICDELGYVSFSRGGVELLFRVQSRLTASGCRGFARPSSTRPWA